MDQRSQNFETLFRDALNQQTMMPSSGVLKRIRFKLWMSDYFSLNPRKFNVAYTTVIVGGAITLFLANSHYRLFNRDLDKIDSQSTEKSINKATNLSSSDNSIEVVTAGPVLDKDEKRFSAAFYIDNEEGCAPFTVHFKNQSTQSSSYEWDFGNGSTSTEKDPVQIFAKPGNFKITLTAINKEGEKDIVTKNIKVKQSPNARFIIDIEKSDLEEKNISFKNISSGSKSYTWDFGDNAQSVEKDPVHRYANFGTYKVELIAEAPNGCKDTLELANRLVEKNYELAFPLNFRPNISSQGNDGYYAVNGSKGSIFYPKNNGVESYELRIFAPNGLEVFSTLNIQQGWNGYIKGRLAPAGNYSYKTKGTYPNGQPFEIKGSFKVIIEDYY